MSATRNMWEHRFKRLGGGLGIFIDRNGTAIICCATVFFFACFIALGIYYMFLDYRAVSVENLEKKLAGPDTCFTRALREEVGTATTPITGFTIQRLERRCENVNILEEQKRVLK